MRANEETVLVGHRVVLVPYRCVGVEGKGASTSAACSHSPRACLSLPPRKEHVDKVRSDVDFEKVASRVRHAPCAFTLTDGCLPLFLLGSYTPALASTTNGWPTPRSASRRRLSR